MPVQPTYPGVYVEEIASGLRTVTGVATSVAAFVGSFERGLLNEAVQIFGMADFEREYGGLDRNSETSYAIQQFFLNGGTQAWVVRVVDTLGALPLVPAAAAAAVMLHELVGGLGQDVMRVRAGRRIRGASASNPGEWGNQLRIDVDYATADPREQFNLTISEVRIDGDRTIVVRTERFPNLTMRPDTPTNAIEVVNQRSDLIQLDRDSLAALPASVVGTPYPLRPAATGTMGDALALPATIPAEGAPFDVDLAIGGVGIVGGPLAGTIRYFGATPPTTYAGFTRYLQEAVRRAAGDPLVTDAMRPLLSGALVSLVNQGTSAVPLFHFAVTLGRAARPYDPATTAVFSNAAATMLGLDVASAPNDQQFALAGGHDGRAAAPGTTFRPIDPAMFVGTSAAKTGLFALDDVDLFNILCVPEATTFPAQADRFAFYTQATDYVRERRAMLIIDVPEADARTLPNIETWIAENDGLRDPNTAVYFPRTNVPDPLNQNRARSVASSGTIAGLWARTDTARGVWKAPAGTDARLRNVVSLGYAMTDQENGVLNPLGINCLRTFPVYSNICWGARTLDGADVLASDWKYVPVRRTTLFLEESLFRGTKWVVFEPNDEPLWSQIRLNVGAFMHDLFRQGAFQGATPAQAYYVRCDGTTTTQQDIDRGIVNIEVGFAPLKPAEFVILKIQQIVRSADA